MADANILKPFVLAWEGGYVFQSTPLREGRLFPVSASVVTSWFQSTPLCEGRRQRLRNIFFTCACFNPRPYVRGDIKKAAYLLMSQIVSIHAPT